MFILLILLFVLLFFLFLKYVYSFWDRQGLSSLKCKIPYGNLESVAKKKTSFGMALYDLYQQTNLPFVGIYLLWRPAILVRDAHIAHQMLTSEFNSFHDRGVYCNEKNDPLSANLFNLPGERWRFMRQKLTPTFTSGKLKNMVPKIKDVSRKMIEKIDDDIQANKTIDMKELSGKFTIDIIASVFFGIEIDSINNPNNEFRTAAQEIRSNFWNAMRLAAMFLCPKFLVYLNISFLSGKIRKFVSNMVRETIEFRERNNYTRKDFMQLLIDLRKEDVSIDQKPLTVEQISAQVFIFFIASQENTAAVIMFCLHELTQNSEKMAKVKEDIDNALQIHNGEVTYDSINEMKYLECCVLETMRKYSLPLLNRECTKDFQMPNSNFVVQKGTPIIISIRGIQMDPEYFPEPEKFIPERFSDEEKNYDEKAYFALGEGPRYCIGARFGKYVVKHALAELLSKYNIKATQGLEVEFEINSIVLLPVEGLHFKMTKNNLSKNLT